MVAYRRAHSLQMESALVADCGSNITRVVLVEVVDNAYRFIARGEAPSTAGVPYQDVTVGILNAVAIIEQSTGRKLLSNGKIIVPQENNGAGVDAFLASSSAAEPLRLVALGLVHGVSADAAVRGSYATYTTVLDTISLDDYGDSFDPEADASQFIEADFDPEDPEAEFSPFTSGAAQPSIFTARLDNSLKAAKAAKKKANRLGALGNRSWKVRQIAKLRRLSPNVVVLSGGVDGSPFEPLETLLDVVLEANQQEAVLAMATGEPRKPPTLIFAGNTKAQDYLLEKIAGQLECFLVDNIRPTVEQENLEPLQSQLTALYQERMLPGLPGFQHLGIISQAPVTTTCRSVGIITQYLAKQVTGNRVLTADLGGNNTSLFYATEKESASMVRGDFGMSYGLSNVLAATNVSNILRWIPFAITEDEIIHYALNKTLRPNTIPADEREKYIEAAFAREALRVMYTLLASQRPTNLDYNRVIGAGGLLVNSNYWQAVLILLDALQPVGGEGTGLIELELDATRLLSAAGTLAAYNANAAAYIFQYDCLHRLGPVIVPIGQASLGSPAVTVTLRTKRGRTREVTVNFGDIKVVPLHTDEQAIIEIAPTRNFRIGSAAPGTVVKSQEYINGGSVGLVIDARGRPIRFPSDPELRQDAVANWHGAYRTALQQLENETDEEFSFSSIKGEKVKAALPPPAPEPKPEAPKPVQKTFKPEEKLKPETPPLIQKEQETTFRPNAKIETPRLRLEKGKEELPSLDSLREELTGKSKKKKK